MCSDFPFKLKKYIYTYICVYIYFIYIYIFLASVGGEKKKIWKHKATFSHDSKGRR